MSSKSIGFLRCYISKYGLSWSGREDFPKVSYTCGQKGKGLMYSKDKRKRWKEWEVALQSLCFKAVAAQLATWQLSGAAIPQRTAASLHMAVSIPAPRRDLLTCRLDGGQSSLLELWVCLCSVAGVKRNRKREGNFISTRTENAKTEKPRERQIRLILYKFFFCTLYVLTYNGICK